MDSTSSQAQRDKLETEIKAAEEKAIEAEREFEDVVHKEKLTESAQQEGAASITQIQMTADNMKRIKAKANEAKQKAATANKNLLSEISKQLGND